MSARPQPAHRPQPAAGGGPPSIPFDRALPAAVAARVGPARFNLWFQGHARFVPLGSEVVVVTRTESCRDWLEHTFGKAIKDVPPRAIPGNW